MIRPVRHVAYAGAVPDPPATAGRVDDEQVFYAQARGLTRKEAIRMVVAGFFQQIFDRITIDSVREALGEAIGRRIREYE